MQKRIAGNMSAWVWLFLLIPSCGELSALSNPILGKQSLVVLSNGERWTVPIGCTTPWGITESAQGAANIRRIDDFPGDADWVNVSGNGKPDNPRIHVLTTGPVLWEQLGGWTGAVDIVLGRCGICDGVTR